MIDAFDALHWLARLLILAGGAAAIVAAIAGLALRSVRRGLGRRQARHRAQQDGPIPFDDLQLGRTYRVRLRGGCSTVGPFAGFRRASNAGPGTGGSRRVVILVGGAAIPTRDVADVRAHEGK